MADNVAITAGSGTAIASDDVGSVHYQRVKLDVGGDGVASPVVGSLPVTGDVAHDAVDSGNPSKIGGVARQANPTAVAALDRVAAMFDDVGRLVTAPYHVRDLVTTATVTLSNTTETTLLAAAASTFHDVVSLTLTSATATATLVTLRDTTGGSGVALFALPASGTLHIPFPVPFKQSTVNTNWTLQLGTGSVTVYAVVVAVKNV